MNNQKISNPKTEVPETKNMNERDYLNDLLETEKNMSVNLTIALNEASNEQLYNKIKNIYESVKQSQRDLFELMFRNGWYCLEKAEEQKITQSINKLEQSMQELNN